MHRIWLTLLLVCSTAMAETRYETLSRIAQAPWHGMSEQRMDETVSGRIRIEQWIDMKLGAGDALTGKARSTVTFYDGKTPKSYQASSTITGKLVRLENTAELVLSDIKGDPLPRNIPWCNSTAKLKFFEDKDKPGHFLLKGTFTSTGGGGCVGTSQVQYVY